MGNKGFNAGSVTAEIRADITQFDSAITELIEKVGMLETSLKKTGDKNIVKDIQNVMEQYNIESKTIDKVTKSLEEELLAFKKQDKAHKTHEKALKDSKKATDDFIGSTQSLLNNFGANASKVSDFNSKLKETENQAKKTEKSIHKFQNQFNKMLWERIGGMAGKKGVFDGSFKNQMKWLYDSLDSKEFNQLWNQALKDMNIKSRQMGNEAILNLGGLVKPTEHLIEKTKEVTTVTQEFINTTSNQFGKAITQANNLSSAIEKVGEKSKKSESLVKELGLATDQFGFVGLGELINKFDQLPVHLQKAVKNVSRVIQKGHKGLYPKKGYNEFINDMIYTAFPISKAGIPFNTQDAIYTDLMPFDLKMTTQQLEDQKRLFDQILTTFGEFYPEEYKIIQGIGKWSRNQRTVKEELEYTLETLKMTEPYIRSTAKAIDTLKASGLKFMTSRQEGSPYFLNGLLSEKNGFDYYSKIRPKNVKDRFYSVQDKYFLENFLASIYKYRAKGNFEPTDARHVFKYPSWKQLGMSEIMNMPYGQDYISNFKDGTKKSYDEFVKYAHTQMIRALKQLDIDFSTELARNSEKAVRVWFENLGKFKNIGSLDLSKMIKFDDYKSAMAYVEMLTKDMASLGYGMDKTAMRTTKLNYALEETLSKFKVVSWGTPEQYKNAELGFRNLIVEANNLNKAEKKVIETTKELETSMLDLSGKTKYTYEQLWANFDKLPREIQTALEGMNRSLYKVSHGMVLDDKVKGKYSNYGMRGEFEGWAKQIEHILNLGSRYKNVHLFYPFDGKHNKEMDKYLYNIKELDKYFKGHKKAIDFNGGSADFTKVPIGVYRQLLRLLQETEIVSRKTGEAITQLGEVEEKTAKSTEILKNELNSLAINKGAEFLFNPSLSLNELVKNANKMTNIQKKGLKQLVDLYFEDEMKGITDSKYFNSQKDKWDKLLKELNLGLGFGIGRDSTLSGHKNQNKLFHELDELLTTTSEKVNQVKNNFEILNRVKLGDTWTVTLKSTNMSIKETVVILDKWIESTSKAVEAEKQLVEGTNGIGKSMEATSAGISQLVNAIQPISSKVSLTALKEASIRTLSGNISKAVNQAKSLSSAIKRAGESAKEAVNEIKNLPIVIEKFSESSEKAGEKASESFNKANESSKKFYEEEEARRRRWDKARKEQARKYYNDNFGMSEYSLNYKNIFQQLNAVDKRLEEIYGRKFNSRYLRMPRMGGEYNAVTFGKNITHSTTALKTFDNTVITTASDLHNKLLSAMKQIYEQNKKSKEPLTLPLKNWKEGLSELKAFELRYTSLMNRMYNLSRGLGANRNAGKTNTGYGALLDAMYGKDYISPFIGKIRKATDLFSAEGSLGRVNVVGYSDYVAQITQINKALTESSASSDKFKASLTEVATAIKSTGLESFVGTSERAVLVLTQMAEANERFAKQPTTQTDLMGQVEREIQVLQHFSNMSEKNRKTLAGLSEQAIITRENLSALAQGVIDGSLSEEQYNREINKVTESLKKLGSTAQTEIRKLALNNTGLEKSMITSYKGMENVGKSISRANECNNRLYQGLQKVKGTIVSIKTIFTAMGGMAIWGFMFDLVDGVKESFTAKNEMEAQLLKNPNVVNKNKGSGGMGAIQLFNKGLDDTTKKFKKINKYSIGETVSSIGLEFDLSAKQMVESMDIIAMVQSEYVRAGRKESEAALAVKDILQGEFSRLSRETGVGKDELQELGWNGDKKDVESLMKAIRRAAKDRHWDKFAEKATSINDVVTILKSRFGEFGADIIQTITPLVISGFNGLSDAIEWITGKFNGLNDFWKPFILTSAVPTGFFAVSTGILALAKNIGFADVAMMGFKRSLGTAIFKLNKVDVATYGLKNSIMAMISGTTSAEVANIGFRKSLMARLFGVNQNILAEKGLLTAMVQSKSVIKGETLALSYAELGSMKFSQKLAYLAGNLSITDAKSAGLAKSLKALVTSTKLWATALAGLGLIGVAWSLATFAEKASYAKSQVEGFYNVVDNGKDLVKDAQSTYDGYVKSIDDINNKISERKAEGKDTWKLEQQLTQEIENRKQAYKNLGDVKHANDLAQEYDKDRQKEISDANLKYQKDLEKAYQKTGSSITESEVLASKYTAEVINGNYFVEQGNKAYKDRLDQVKSHVIAQGNAMKEAGADQKAVNKYITEYSVKVQEVADNWKKLQQGDMMAGVNAVIGEITLAWIDIANHPDVVKLFNNLGQAWKDMQPTITTIKDGLTDIGLKLVDLGNWVSTNKDFMNALPWVGLGAGILFVGKKLYNFIGGTKSTLDILKTLSGKLKLSGKKWKWWGDKAEEANEKANSPSTSTGGITGDTGKLPLKEELKNIGKNRLKSFTNNALIIVEGMLLVTEAIYMLKAPMWSLSEVGKDFKAQEPQIREGIEGLQLIAPVVGTFLIPIIALHQVLSKYGKFMDSWGDLKGNLKAFATMALGIVEGMILVSEAIIMVVPSIWALGALGDQYSNIETQVHKGTEAMKVVADSLMYLAPFIPALALGVATVALAFSNPLVAGIIGASVTLGIPLGMIWVAETIWSLEYPLNQIASLGSKYTDLGSVKQGTEAIKVTAEALGYVNDAMTSLTGIDLNLLAQTISDIVAGWFGVDLGSKLTDLTKEDGVLTQLNDFVKAFNSDKFTIKSPDPDKVTALASAGDGIKTIGDAMSKVKVAMDSIPDEFKGESSTNDKYQENVGNKAKTVDVDGYFATFEEPLKQLKDFVDKFNDSDDFDIQPIDPARVENLSKTADMISTVNDAVNKVKTTMQGISDSQWNTSQAQGGILTSIGNFLYHQSGVGTINNGQASGDYKSSLGSSLKEMEDVVSDIFTFQGNINSITSGGNGENANVDGATAMVTIIQDAISKLATSLSDAIPTFEGKGNAISQAIIKGVNTGLEGLPNIPAKIANKIMTNKDTVYNTANSLGNTTANKFKDGVAPMSDYMADEMKYTNDALNGNYHDILGTSAYNLGQYVSSQYKNGLDMHSPGIMARATADEVGFIGDALSVNNLPQMAFDLANSLSNNFKLDFGLSNLQLPDVTQLLQGFNVIPTTVSNIKTKVSTDFTNLQNGLSTNFTNITSKTRTTMSNILSMTTKNITGIKTSWKGMQNALISSADHIRTQTTSKIDKLKSNLGDFWNKIQHPDQLIAGSAGGKPTGTIRRRSKPHIRTPTYAGSPTLFKPKISTQAPDDDWKQYMECILKTGKPCYAGWNFNWTNKIKDKFNGWNTHFNKYNLDSHLNVGKFNNSNFPVKGQADIFKDYIYDVIKGTTYDFYFNSKYGSPAEALRAGHFNCWDGTQIIIALANAFGLGASQGHGTWNGIGHMFAKVAGIGVIDPTAIQQNGTFKSPKVKGYSAGSKPRYSPKGNDEQKIVHNHGDTVVNINAPIYGVEDLENAIENGVKKAQRKLLIKSYSGV